MRDTDLWRNRNDTSNRGMSGPPAEGDRPEAGGRVFPPAVSSNKRDAPEKLRPAPNAAASAHNPHTGWKAAPEVTAGPRKTPRTRLRVRARKQLRTNHRRRYGASSRKSRDRLHSAATTARGLADHGPGRR